MNTTKIKEILIDTQILEAHAKRTGEEAESLYDLSDEDQLDIGQVLFFESPDEVKIDYVDESEYRSPHLFRETGSLVRDKVWCYVVDCLREKIDYVIGNYEYYVPTRESFDV